MLLVLSINVSANLEDPTRPDDYATPIAVDSEPVEEETKNNLILKLSAIFTYPTFNHAIINGLSVQQGDIVFSGIKILDIQESSVTILIDGQPQELLLSTQIKRTSQGFSQ